VPKSKQEIGQHGEALAVNYLRQHNYTIIETNWHCSHGELDIITQLNDLWVFVEVRTRRSHSTESAFASITPSKRQKLVDSVNLYLHEHKISASNWRIDVIAVALPHSRSATPIIDHVEDALDW